ncbi:hypothetical protein LIER_22084 [Lithospermum erythrorhizon]|uniref:Uncharacterized protein n=1 Tax=Lithospermum erythrorhizon TaxID=34254 RepID=A0AAV3QV15_LITER
MARTKRTTRKISLPNPSPRKREKSAGGVKFASPSFPPLASPSFSRPSMGLLSPKPSIATPGPGAASASQAIADDNTTLYQQARDMSKELAQERLKVEALEQEHQGLRLQVNNYPWDMACWIMTSRGAKQRGMLWTVLLAGKLRAYGAPAFRTTL